MTEEKVPHILFIFDDQAGRERKSALTQILYGLRGSARTTVLTGVQIEDEVLHKLQMQGYDLVLVPLRYYAHWQRIEALFGLNRTSGPTVSAYFIEPTLPGQLPAQLAYLRAICLDFARITPSEAAILIRALAIDSRRSGLAPLLTSGTPIYFDVWTQTRESGSHFDSIFGLKEWNQSEWSRHNHSLRVALAHLWSFVFDQGAARSTLTDSQGTQIPRAWFQVAFQPNVLLVRLLAAVPDGSAKAVLNSFWPKSTEASRRDPAIHGLRSSTDFLRVHSIAETGELEITLGWLPSRPSLEYPDEQHTLWIEPLSQKKFKEPPYLTPSDDPRLKPLRVAPGATDNPAIRRARSENLEAKFKTQERLIVMQQTKLSQLRRLADDQEMLIKELRRGGVGAPQRFEAPDAPALLDALKARLREAGDQIRTLHARARQTLEVSPTSLENEALRKRLETLLAQDRAWTSRLNELLEEIQKRQELLESSAASPAVGTERKRQVA
jgi:hypothetical protein